MTVKKQLLPIDLVLLMADPVIFLSRHQNDDGDGHPTLPVTSDDKKGDTHASDRLQCDPLIDARCSQSGVKAATAN